jgi:branched-chain amino acid transport system permease protein
VFLVAFAGAWILGITEDPVTWLAVALAATAVVAFLPGAKRAITPPTEIEYGEPEEHHAPVGGEPAVEAVKEGPPLLVASDVVKTFGGVRALRGVSMTLDDGELVGLVGPNGSGKTTLVNLMSGALRPTSGTVSVNGTETVGSRPHRIAHLGIARTYQIPRPFTSLTVRDNVAMAIMFGREPLGLDGSRQAAGEYLDLVGLGGRAEAYPGEINLHQRQLLEMARAIATRPSLLLLDEALAGLNPVEIDNAVEVVRRIQRSGVSIVLVEHLLRVVNQLATRIVVLDQGQVLAEGMPAVVMRDPAVIKAYLGRQADASS